VPIVLNEWIIHELAGENGLVAQRESASFLQFFRDGAETIAVLRGSPWMDKAFWLTRIEKSDVRILSKFLHLAILIDPSKCRFVEPEEVEPLPDDLAKDVPVDDVYLFQTALAGQAGIIVTSDLRLIQRVTSAPDRGIQLVWRNDYLAQCR
jgi:hypothetical protein